MTAAALLLAALTHLGARRIALVTPYPQAINDKERKFFAENGVEVMADESIIVDDEQQKLRKMYKVPTGLLVERAVALGDAADVEAVVLSCCDMPTMDAIPEIEARTGKPVISNLGGMVWNILHRVGMWQPIPGRGRLLASE